MYTGDLVLLRHARDPKRGFRVLDPLQLNNSVNFQSSLGDFDVGVKNWPSMQSFGH
jgi:hypothetical protein